jgi:ABC-type transporter Mla subunit MlaD
MSIARGTTLRVGLLIIVGVVAAIWLAMFLGGSRIHNGRVFESYFQESVQGLELGAPVKYRGVTLGRVNQIGLASTLYLPGEAEDARRATYRLVFVRYIIDLGRIGQLAALEAAVRGGLRARLATQGITGLAYIELDYVDPAKFPASPVPWKPQYDVIPTVPSTLAQVQDAAQQLLARINAVDIVALGQGSQRVLDDLHTQLTTGDAHQVLANSAALAESTRAAVERADLPALAAELRGAAADLRAVVNGPEGRGTLAAVARAADRIATAAARLPALMATLDTAARRAGGGLADLQSDLAPVLRDARAAVANLRETTEQLRRYPAGVLLGAPPPREDKK